MNNNYDLGLSLPIEKELERAAGYLNKSTSENYKELLSKLINSAYDIQFNAKLTKEHLEMFELGMRQPLELIFSYYSGRYVSMLSHHFAEAEEIFKKLCNDKSSKIRYNAVTLLLSKPSENAIKYVVKNCINDVSEKVRKKVADVCGRLELHDMIDLLENQFNNEQNEDVKKSYLFSISILKHGYLLGEERNGVHELLIKTDKGLTGISVKRDILMTHSIDEVVKFFRENGRLPE